MNQKQSNLLAFAKQIGVDIVNISEYQNKDSEMVCKCSKGHTITGTVDYLLKTNFECIECKHIDAININDTTPFFLSLDAASYTTGMSIFNREGQMLKHKALNVDKKKDFFTRIDEIKREVERIIKDCGIKCVILEDIQYQQNPVLFKKLAMLQGVLRYCIINELKVELITAMADEWRAYNYIYGSKRPDQKKAAIEKATRIFGEEISEDESESIFLGYYGIHLYNEGPQKED